MKVFSLTVQVFFFQGSKVPVKDSGTLSVSGVYFTCPLSGATLTKSEREVHIKEAILMVRLRTLSLAFVSSSIKTLLTPLGKYPNVFGT